MVKDTITLKTLTPIVTGVKLMPGTDEDRLSVIKREFAGKYPGGVVMPDDETVTWESISWADLLPTDEKNALLLADWLETNGDKMAAIRDAAKRLTALRAEIVDEISDIGYTLPNVPDFTPAVASAGGGKRKSYIYEVGRIYIGRSSATTGRYGIRVDSVSNGKPAKCTVVNADGTALPRGHKTNFDSFTDAAFHIASLVGQVYKNRAGLNAPREYQVPKLD